MNKNFMAFVVAALLVAVTPSFGQQELVEGSYLVTFSADKGSVEMETVLQEVGAYGAFVHRRLITKTNSVVMHGVTPEAVTELQARGARLVQEFLIPIPTDYTNLTPKGTPYSWGLDRIDQRDLPLDGAYTAPSKGMGVVAYIFDTGVNPNTTEFGNRLEQGINFFEDQSEWDTSDPSGHGSHMASIIGGKSYGVAPGVTIVPVRVGGLLNGVEGISHISLALGIDWAMADRANRGNPPAVANMSFGGLGSTGSNTEINMLANSGVFISGGAGNDGADACDFWPSNNPLVLSAGAVDSDDSMAWFSNYGQCVDIFAPGRFTETAFGLAGGTSAAAAYMSGIAALCLEENPTASPATVRTMILAGATVGAVYNEGAGSPNLLAYTVGKDEPTGPCVANGSTLCLTDGRFRVTLDYQRKNDPAPLAAKSQVTGNWSGIFYFSNPDNSEMLVKVIPGCPVDGHFWVFYAATTNVSFTLTVKDTDTGESQFYQNPQGNKAESVQDNNAFACN